MARQIPDDNLAYPCLLTLGQFSGSGFLLNEPNEIYLVTARHVLFHADPFDPLANGAAPKDPTLRITAYTRDLAATVTIVADLPALIASGDCRYHATYDAAVIRIAQAQGNIAQGIPGVTIQLADPSHVVIGVSTASVSNFADVLVANDIFVFGYPNSIGLPGNPQHDHSRPLIRKGIVAGINTANRTIIIDCPVYQGNSGGLVLEKRNQALAYTVHVIGLVSSFIPFAEITQSLHFGTRNTSIENSGYAVVVPMDFVLPLVNQAP